ncbi:transient receptor potential cation channel subfamily M member 6-like [Paramuricea clavata]|uniref:Transient receptor potential cation channel subfamily M member 6-like n=1 Tax=Paramuricea clavata TaxID=317549 RepID=A0A6S7IPU2_PARCT|nr:transient receptor potential cation channel subfamily M member 6-like [Paramuricea clavata]
MAEKWRKFKEDMKKKRLSGKSQKGKDVSKREITVQMLSADVSGKAQKYSRIGPREFVQLYDDDDEDLDRFYTKEEMTVERVKDACLKHFEPKVGNNVVCDILAGEQGPSCASLKQIPNMNLIYVRSINKSSTADAPVFVDDTDPVHPQSTTVKRKGPNSVPSPKKAKISTPMPKSLSVTHMLKLGKLINKSTTTIHLYGFNLADMSWSSSPRAVEFSVSEDVLGEGAFRKAYKAESKDESFAGSWVVKEYNENALDVIAETNQTLETHTKKVVQMHSLAQNFASQLKTSVEQNGMQESFGDCFHYGSVYLGKKGDEFVTVEEFVDGEFSKYINNDGTLCKNVNEVILQKAECLSHFSFEKSNNQVMVLDIQGCGYSLVDPEVASSSLFDENKELLFTTGNLSFEAIAKFKLIHRCNEYCELLKLKVLV